MENSFELAREALLAPTLVRGYAHEVRHARPIALVSLLAALAAPLFVAPRTAQADFSAGGRKKGGKPPPGGVKPPPGGAIKPPGGAVKPPPTGKPDEPKGPGQDVLITRYTGIVLSQPASPFPLQRLAQL